MNYFFSFQMYLSVKAFVVGGLLTFQFVKEKTNLLKFFFHRDLIIKTVKIIIKLKGFYSVSHKPTIPSFCS